MDGIKFIIEVLSILSTTIGLYILIVIFTNHAEYEINVKTWDGNKTYTNVKEK